MPAQDSNGVRIHHEGRELSGIEQDGIGRLRTHSLDGQELLAQSVHAGAEQDPQISSALLHDERHQVLQTGRLDVEISRGADELGQTAVVHLVQDPRIERVRFFEGGDGLHHIFPCGVLREHRSDHHFQRRFTGPPTARPEVTEKQFENVHERGGAFGIHEFMYTFCCDYSYQSLISLFNTHSTFLVKERLILTRY